MAYSYTPPIPPPPDQDQEQTHYEILQISTTASLQDIKKAYRKLALQHHPDRNPPERKDEATVQFRHVNEAYETLSDPERRRQYDWELQQGRPTTSSNGQYYPPQHPRHPFHHHEYYHHQYRDPFAQFNDLFRNDPFFSDAFRDMDDLFAKTFQQQHGMTSHQQQQQQQQRQAFIQPQQPQPKPTKSWGRWIADCLGINFQIQTSTTTIGPDGRPMTSTSQTTYGNANHHHHHNNNQQQQQQGNRRSYTSKSTRTIIENGQRVTIQSLERDGNKIEEKYIDNQLVQRLINGIPEHQYRIHGRANNAHYNANDANAAPDL